MSESPTVTGVFQGTITTAEVQPKESGAVQVFVVVQLEAWHDKGEWLDCSAKGWQCAGWLTIQNKSGALNEITAKQLGDMGWHGDFAKIPNLVNRPCNCTVEDNTFNGQTTKRIKGIYPRSQTAGRVAPPCDAAALNAAHGATLRALLGSAPAQPQVTPATDEIPF